ncbi:MAG: hypothetical protein J3K34DRAFT_198481 [Monoraphidium minutum]|nr:MAG: hypothetical protein J3K34DRAFT_198481 [Monoraphidium minutum]
MQPAVCARRGGRAGRRGRGPAAANARQRRPRAADGGAVGAQHGRQRRRRRGGHAAAAAGAGGRRHLNNQRPGGDARHAHRARPPRRRRRGRRAACREPQPAGRSAAARGPPRAGRRRLRRRRDGPAAEVLSNMFLDDFDNLEALAARLEGRRAAQPAPKACAVCSAAGQGLSRCSSCKQSWYCSKDHQLAHWPQHKLHCTPAAAAAPAAEPAASDVASSSTPAPAEPRPPRRSGQCAVCGKTSADGVRLRSCAGCRRVRYYSVECARVNWVRAATTPGATLCVSSALLPCRHLATLEKRPRLMHGKHPSSTQQG